MFVARIFLHSETFSDFSPTRQLRGNLKMKATIFKYVEIKYLVELGNFHIIQTLFHLISRDFIEDVRCKMLHTGVNKRYWKGLLFARTQLVADDRLIRPKGLIWRRR